MVATLTVAVTESGVEVGDGLPEDDALCAVAVWATYVAAISSGLSWAGGSVAWTGASVLTAVGRLHARVITPKTIIRNKALPFGFIVIFSLKFNLIIWVRMFCKIPQWVDKRS